jgi:hypothetical protein
MNPENEHIIAESLLEIASDPQDFPVNRFRP